MRTHHTILLELDAAVAQERTCFATALDLIGQVDAARLYLSAGHPSMFAYCVDHLHLSEGAAYKRIQTARAARKYPILLAALRDGRIHLSAAYLLSSHLTPGNANELVTSAAHRRKSAVKDMVDRQFGKSEERTPAPILRALPAKATPQLPPGAVETDLLSSSESQSRPGEQLSPATVETTSATPTSPTPQTPPTPPALRAAEPPADERHLLKLIIDKAMHDKLREFQALVSHSVPSGDIAKVLERALEIAIAQAKKAKCGATARPKATKATPAKGRHIPAAVRRAVWKRDQGRCTFVGERGHRCDARTFVEYDHVEPVARGGRATVDGVRLRCRAHNQLEAERMFGAEFMRRKRDERQAALAMVHASR